MDASLVLDMVFGAMSACVEVLQTITFGGVPLFYIMIGFLILSAVITYILNVTKSPYVESETQSQGAKRRAARSRKRGD